MELIDRIFNYRHNNPKVELIPLAIVLILAGYFYLHNLGTDYITLWDEAVHVNVVKNLAQDPWSPKLRSTDIGMDFRDWSNNYIWVHKPLLPLYVQAVFYKVGEGVSSSMRIKSFDVGLFAFRLPGVLFALMSIAALHFIVRRHFGYIAAITAASLFAFNSYVFELVKGRQFSGLHDLMFGFLGILVLDRILKIAAVSSPPTGSASDEERKDSLTLSDTSNTRFVHSPSKTSSVELTGRKQYLYLGLLAGLAYLSKSGLALLFFPALVAAIFFQKSSSRGAKMIFGGLLYSVVVMIIVVLPEKIGLLLLFPAEYYFEQTTQVMHLFSSVEYWGRRWDYYLTVYLRDLLLPYLYMPAIASIVWAIGLSFRKLWARWYLNTLPYLGDGRVKTLAVWVLSFLVFLSFGVSKISNFIFAVLPALLILVVLMFEWLWKAKHYAVLFALSLTIILSYGLTRFDVFRSKYHLFQDQVFLQRFAMLFYAIWLFCALWTLYRLAENFFKSGFLAKSAAAAALLLVLGTYARANQLSDRKIREDYQYQQKIKQVALKLKDEQDLRVRPSIERVEETAGDESCLLRKTPSGESQSYLPNSRFADPGSAGTTQGFRCADSDSVSVPKGRLSATLATPIFLIDYPKLYKADLYFQYWSGFDAIQVHNRQPVSVLKKFYLGNSRPVFVLSEKPLQRDDLSFSRRTDSIFVYRLKTVHNDK